MKPKPVIAIDGPAGSGKGTISRLLADHLGFAYLDTGILYRAVAYKKINFDEAVDLSIHDLLKIIKEIPKKNLRSDAVGVAASNIAKLPNVREIMTRLQRDFTRNPGEKYKGSVLDGRDIATVVVPNADCKIFITASLEIRAARRFKSLEKTNSRITYKEVYDNMKARDEQDKSRKTAPLSFNGSYTLVDTSNDSIEESLKKVIAIVTQHPMDK
ncbi:MAG: cytidylate kinase [Holosporaceae bacterium]|jgi:cytidylate kinase|nr:cytidylate kinase [Holosporaceae bacterium]